MYKVSIVIPVYNSEKKIERSILSILNQTMTLKDIEVIFVDDCSKDRSASIIKEYCKIYKNFKYIKLESNSGSPSRPRNRGIQAASAEYILFLDSDDMLCEGACHLLYSEAIKNDYDIVRGYLKVFKAGNQSFYMNRLPREEYENVAGIELIKNLIVRQSTTVVGLYKRDFLISHNITFDEQIRMGEDTLFLSKCYSETKKVHYINECIYYYVKRDELHNVSSTQNYGSRELNDHLAVWIGARNILKKIGLDYYKLRLHTGFRAALEYILNFSNGKIPEEDFKKLRAFLLENKYIIPKMKLNQRLQEITNAIVDGDYHSFVINTRKRILINGYDLKFIKPLVPILKEKFEVEIDEWQGHDKHDEEKSKKLLQWADVIFCEWLLGNAVWYSHNKLKHQLLFVRMHRFELFEKYGELVNVTNVDGFIAVGLYYYEMFMEKFQIPREKMNLIPNYVDIDRFRRNKESTDFKYNLALIGALPSRKRIDLAVKVLDRLLEYDPKYKLHIIGSRPEEIQWLWKKDEERNYYEQVYKKISDSPKLKDAVIFTGWQDTSEYLRKIGFVLSVSDDEKPESFHLAPAEGMASGAVGLLLKWPGVEYIYPSEFTVENIEELVAKILDLMDESKYEKYRVKGERFIRKYYHISEVANKFELLIQRGFLRRN